MHCTAGAVVLSAVEDSMAAESSTHSRVKATKEGRGSTKTVLAILVAVPLTLWSVYLSF